VPDPQKGSSTGVGDNSSPRRLALRPLLSLQGVPLVEDQPGSGQDEKNEGDQFGYQNFERRDRWERHVSPLETRLIILKTDFAIQ